MSPVNETHAEQVQQCKCNTKVTRRVRNVQTDVTVKDTLHRKAAQPRLPDYSNVCTSSICTGSFVNNKPRKLVHRSHHQVLEEATKFLQDFYAHENKLNSEEHEGRWKDVIKELSVRGTYCHTLSELKFGVQMAWRNSSRCIGRMYWNKLHLFDYRLLNSTDEMFEALLNHIRYSTNDGLIRPTASVFSQNEGISSSCRIWNPSLISYAGYRLQDGSIIGDPMNVEFTQVCINLGWKSKKTRFDVLPLVLQLKGSEPAVYSIPEDLILRVPITHPSNAKFEKLKLEWYALPAISNMKMECGGVDYCCVAFSGWYMVTEIAIRNLLDPHRYNLCQEVATILHLDEKSNSTFWKDEVAVEMMRAVTFSFQQKNVTIVDHHTAAELFQKFFQDEYKLRGGCPADWPWIVPPTGGSLTPVFHQEMLLYSLRPSYEYQKAAWTEHYEDLESKEESKKSMSDIDIKPNKLRKAIKSVLFSSGLFVKQLEKRVKCLILYATETGRAERFARRAEYLFSHTFNVKTFRMADYDSRELEFECLVLVIASTFGNGDPPSNGLEFARFLQNMVGEERQRNKSEASNSSVSNSTASSQVSTKAETNLLDLPILSNISYGVFALGSSAYQRFCFFGRFVDVCFKELNANRLRPLGIGDELCGQDASFERWKNSMFTEACKHFDISLTEENLVEKLIEDTKWSKSKVNLQNSSNSTPLKVALQDLFKKQVSFAKIVGRTNLYTSADGMINTVKVEIDTREERELEYNPGDHVVVFPVNRKHIVNSILDRVREVDPDITVQVLNKKVEYFDDGSTEETWAPHEQFPHCSLRVALTRYLDITTPPTQHFLSLLARYCDLDDSHKLLSLSTDTKLYEQWIDEKHPNIEDLMNEFPSCTPPAEMLFTCLPYLQPRCYSVSSSMLAHPSRIHLTVSVLKYYNNDKSSKHYGVCSNYLRYVNIGEEIAICIEKNSSFVMPEDLTIPIIMVAAGSGIAPFRGFWQFREWQYKHAMTEELKNFGQMILCFGCPSPEAELYEDELFPLLQLGALTDVHVAFSRKPDTPKTYVQNKLTEYGKMIANLLTKHNAQFYVSGDIRMAYGVEQAVRQILVFHADIAEAEVDSLIESWKVSCKYCEDIFGIVLNIADIRRAGHLEAEKKQSLTASK